MKKELPCIKGVLFDFKWLWNLYKKIKIGLKLLTIVESVMDAMENDVTGCESRLFQKGKCRLPSQHYFTIGYFLKFILQLWSPNVQISIFVDIKSS